MDKSIAVVFENDAQAAAGLHALWNLDALGDITVHGAAVIHRDVYGHVDVATKQTDPGVRTAVGIAVGALLGTLAWPLGAAGATMALGTAAGIGATAGGVVGLTADAVESGEHEEAAYETSFVMKAGQSAVIGEISEDWPTPLDTAMQRLGGRIYRRDKDAVRDNSAWGAGYYDQLYPYDYEPTYH